jgi:hypothetical protein
MQKIVVIPAGRWIKKKTFSGFGFSEKRFNFDTVIGVSSVMGKVEPRIISGAFFISKI